MRPKSFRLGCIASLVATLGFVWCGPSVAADSLPSEVRFNDHVRPILTKNCTACHGGVKQAAGISFAYKDDMLSVVEPGDAKNSLMMERITTEEEWYRMPPPEHGPPLSDHEVAILAKWIDQDASWSTHWAYERPQRHAAPPVATESWCRKPIDPFVLSKLESVGAKPAPAAPAERWLRRISLDLTGLPPTPAERVEFLARLDNQGEPAYEQVVDRLLASERFGERWASVWFDLVRYADSRGLSEDTHRDIWKYRDWVIDSFNQDLPFDQFTRKQIAGDLLPGRKIENRLATAVHRLTASNEEGGTDDEEFRVAAVLDRVSTVWEVWQGTTMNCVQCHDHPYDPIPHEDFYRFMAFFNNTADCDLDDDWPSLRVPLDKSDYERASKLDEDISELRRALWTNDWLIAHQSSEWKPLRISSAKSSNSTRIVVESKAGHDEYRTAGTVAKYPTISVELPMAPHPKPITGIRLTVLPLDEQSALKDAEVGFVMSEIDVYVQPTDGGKSVPISIAEAIGDEPFAYSDPNQSLQKGNKGFGAYTRINHPRSVVLIPTEPIELTSESKLTIKVKYGVFNLAAFSLVGRRGSFAISTLPQLSQLRTNTQRISQRKRLKQLEQQRADIRSIAIPVLRERPEHLARPSHRFDRGLFLTKAEQVQPGTPDVLTPSDQSVRNRLEMADWLVSDKNPLTARVVVNRLWARMFGIGLVATEGDFGAAGDLPTHPELLDDLAVRFREEYSWSIKKLLRELALSSTYRQSSAITTDLHRTDSQNRLLSRGPRHTLPAETLRDQILATSGLLELKVGGPPVFPPMPGGVWKARRGSWKTPPIGDPNRYRRSVYTYVKRSVPFPMYATFDAPSRDVCTSKRLRSNTPLQSLMFLNDSGAKECANALARRMLSHSDSLPQQLEFGFSLATCRAATRLEVARLEQLFAEVVKSTDETAAMQSVASVLLNLDEVVTK